MNIYYSTKIILEQVVHLGEEVYEDYDPDEHNPEDVKYAVSLYKDNKFVEILSVWNGLISGAMAASKELDERPGAGYSEILYEE